MLTKANRFLQLHLLTAYPPSNLNRDDLGRPKTAVIGGASRLRVSSQSLKRAWRTSDVFEKKLAAFVGTRTKMLGRQLVGELTRDGIDEKTAIELVKKLVEQFGKPKGDKKDDPLIETETEQAVHFAPEELGRIRAWAVQAAREGKAAKVPELGELLSDRVNAADIALFGRMLASAPRNNIEAACQVGHAFSVQRVAVEDDYFTAVDDLQLPLSKLSSKVDPQGAAHLGVSEFGSGLFYLYFCVDLDLLTANLSGDLSLARKAVSALIEAASTVAPTGKQNSYASRAYASYILAELGDYQPRSLSVAYLSPVGERSGMLDTAIKLLEEEQSRVDKAFGCEIATCCVNTRTGQGTLAGLLEWVDSSWSPSKE